jgi:hypothetical protein
MVLDELRRREAAEAEARISQLHRQQAQEAEAKAAERHRAHLAHDRELHLKTQRVEWLIFWVAAATLVVAALALCHELLRDRQHGGAGRPASSTFDSPSARAAHPDDDHAISPMVAAVAACYGVPPILVTGDEAICWEARQFFGTNCATVAVKKGIGREASAPIGLGRGARSLCRLLRLSGS